MSGHRLAAPETTRDAQRAGARLRSRAASGIHDPELEPTHLSRVDPWEHRTGALTRHESLGERFVSRSGPPAGAMQRGPPDGAVVTHWGPSDPTRRLVGHCLRSQHTPGLPRFAPFRVAWRPGRSYGRAELSEIGDVSRSGTSTRARGEARSCRNRGQRGQRHGSIGAAPHAPFGSLSLGAAIAFVPRTLPTPCRQPCT